MNLVLALRLALKSLFFHRTIALVTILGVAIGMTVIGAILVVDHNTAKSERVIHAHLEAQIEKKGGKPAKRVVVDNVAPAVERITFLRLNEEGHFDETVIADRKARKDASPLTRAVPDQTVDDTEAKSPRDPNEKLGEQDYQAMRLAVRMASLFAFSIGAIIVFYTMRYGVASRQREFALLLTVGEQRRTVASSIGMEAVVMGGLGSALGALLAIPVGIWLLRHGVTTTGRTVYVGLSIPYWELAAFALLGVLVSLAGVMGPVRSILKLKIRDVLQPRFVSEDIASEAWKHSGLGWMLLPLTLAAYLMLRPFLHSWLSVVQFFLVEAVFVVVFAGAVLWWVQPLLSSVIRFSEWLLKRFFPLATLLTGRRMRLTSKRYVFSISGLVLVFSMVMALQGITGSLKSEIEVWANKALLPYQFFFYKPRAKGRFEDRDVAHMAAMGVTFLRMSPRVESAIPYRVVNRTDFNRMRSLDRPGFAASRFNRLFGPGQVILTRTLARRFQLEVGDVLLYEMDGAKHRFEVVEISDEWAYYPEPGQYINVRSYAIFSTGNPLFENIEPFVGRFGAARSRHGGMMIMTPRQAAPLLPYYQPTYNSASLGYAQIREIDRDFLIFDFILAMTILLATVGVVNSMLVQVRARAREFSLLKVVGMGRWQVSGLLLIEGVITGLVSAMLAVILGLVLGLVSVAFLDRFTLFQLDYILSPWAIGGTLVAVPLICMIAAIYPAWTAVRTSSSESLHYE